MLVKNYYYLVMLGAIISWGLCFTVFYNFTPETGFFAVILFLITLFLSLITTLFLINFSLRLISFYKKKKILGREINNAFQQSLLLSLLTIFLLILKANGLLRWWNNLILIFIFFFIQ